MADPNRPNEAHPTEVVGCGVDAGSLVEDVIPLKRQDFDCGVFQRPAFRVAHGHLNVTGGIGRLLLPDRGDRQIDQAEDRNPDGIFATAKHDGDSARRKCLRQATRKAG